MKKRHKLDLLIPHGFETNYVAGFSRGLVSNGVRIIVLSSDDQAQQLDGAGILHLNIRGSQDPDRSVLSKAIQYIRYYLRLLWIVFDHRGSTIHFNGLIKSRIILFEGLFLPIWLRLWAGRYVHTAHNALPHNREKSCLFRWMYRWIYRFPHTILTHTEKIAGQLESEFGVDRSRISIISIGLNEEISDTKVGMAEARRHLGLRETGYLALFFGKIEPYKGVDILIEAWNQIRTKDARLAIAGWCPNPVYAREIRDAIARMPVNETIELHEAFVPNDELAIWMRACDVVVLPYRNIYQSGVVFLCLRFGVPMVATNVGSLAEYINAETGLIARANNPAGIAEALDHFFENPGRFSRDAIMSSAAKYQWNSQCSSIRHLYN